MSYAVPPPLFWLTQICPRTQGSVPVGLPMGSTAFQASSWAATAGAAAGLGDGPAPLDGLGKQAYCFFHVEDWVGRVLKERGEFEDPQGARG